MFNDNKDGWMIGARSFLNEALNIRNILVENLNKLSHIWKFVNYNWLGINRDGLSIFAQWFLISFLFSFFNENIRYREDYFVMVL